MFPAVVVLLLAIADSVLAQSVTVSTSALTPLPCAVTVGTVVTSQTVPAGPLANFGQLATTGGGTVVLGSASLAWSASASPTMGLWTVTLFTYLNGADQARVGPGQFLVTFTGSSPTAMPVRYAGSVAWSGNTAVQLAVDVANDGSIDWQFGTGPLAGTVADLAAQPLVLRVVFDDLMLSVGSATIQLALRIEPDHGIHVFPIGSNCGLTHAYSVEPLFDTTFADVQIRSSTTCWHVLGLQSQPVLLPTALTLTPVPCLVIPTPDLVLRTGTIFLPIPAAVRPIVLYTQLLDFAPGLRVSDTFQIVAF